MWLGVCQRDLQGLNPLPSESLVRGIGAGPS